MERTTSATDCLWLPYLSLHPFWLGCGHVTGGSMITMWLEAQPQAAGTDVNSPLTPWLEVKTSEMKSLQMEAAGSPTHRWRVTEPLTPDVQRIVLWARSKLCPFSRVGLNTETLGIVLLTYKVVKMRSTKVVPLSPSKISTLKEVLTLYITKYQVSIS